MISSTTSPEFWRCYLALPQEIRQAARKTCRLWQLNPAHPSLEFKKLGRVWSCRIAGTGYRALACKEGKSFVWFWIGSHDDYERLLRG
jgi:hypothetical protein